MTKPKRPIIILPPRDTYADKQVLLETLVAAARDVLIRRQQAMVQSEPPQKQAA